MYPFGGYDQNLQALSQQQQMQAMQSVQADFSMFNNDHFFSAIKDIDQMSDGELITLIRNHIDIIVETTLSNKKEIGAILMHPRFVQAYFHVMKNIPIDYDKRLFCNKLCYEYNLMPNKDNALRNLFYEISSYVNHDMVAKLMGRGLDMETANDLVIARFSSRHENINIQRLNFCMYKYDAEVFSEQMIVWIYESLFQRIGELFTFTMLEVYSDQEMASYEDFRDIYGNISMAILAILNNMSSSQIKQVLMIYMDAFYQWYPKTGQLPRFSMRAMSMDYERIVNVVDSMIAGGYEIP